MPDSWYKNAIIYAVDVPRFMDSDGDGRGDFVGLAHRLDYLQWLGVTCLWLLPFYPSLDRDNGYDITNYYGVDGRLGTLDDFLTLVHQAGERSIRVILDLVADHTSDQHPWFQAARRDPNSRYRDYYAWTEAPPPVAPGKDTMFPGQEDTVWTYDEAADAYYHHRFYHFEPDLNTANPEVREEVKKVMDFWLSFDIAGFRVDAANHMIEAHGLPSNEPGDPHGILKELRASLASRKPDAVFLGEVDEAPEALVDYFGDGDELNLLFNFVLDNYLFLAFAREEAEPIVQALRQLPDPPAEGQWANFLRNLDELDLERLTEADRQEVLEAFAPEEEMRIYGRGIRRRLAPMLGGDRRRLELAFSLLFSLPGAPVIVYGDEIGMGEDLSQKGRNAVRAPMQWSDAEGAGFSEGSEEDLVQPVIAEGPFAYEHVNVAGQKDDSDSLLHAVRRLIHMRRQCKAFGYGDWHLIETEHPGILAHRCAWKGRSVAAVHNLTGDDQKVTMDLSDQRGRRLQNLLDDSIQHTLEEDIFELELPPYGYQWYRMMGERG